ncbi:ANL family adenylate-forming protein [Ligilactobacillus apodemi]|uniref:ANL family adenylate-forming protein n=1 Tax=Ligilactobacillus apodemi TaxID=307126 RepID=UPI00214CB5DF|nr:fatty acid--CoA ligase family protein [Ligilactobacillus apodemi]MCR1901403.1 fatty acid--CoA ligase family protein [Ligilactobacillus apodemi]
MIAIDNYRLANKASILAKLINEVSIQFIEYDGNNPENYIATILGTLMSKKTIIIGENENTNSLSKYVVNDATIEDFKLQHNVSLISIVKEIMSNCEVSNVDALVVSTSGSVSSPKSVIFTYKSVLYRVNMIIKEYKLNDKTKELVILPMTSAAIIFDQILPTLLVNGRLFFSQNLNLLEIKQELYKEYDYTGITPTVLNLLEKVNIVWDKIKVKNIALGGEPINFEKITNVSKKVSGTTFYPMYGLTETAGAIVGSPYDTLRSYDSVGLSYEQIELKIVNNILFIRDIGLGRGYLSNGEILKFTDRDGWLNTGDIAYKDKNGYLFILGRKKSVIIIGGVNVYPYQIRNTINMYPGVIDSIVYGKKETADSFREYIVADIYVSDNKIDFKKLKKFVSSKLEKIKVPKEWNLIDNIPIYGLGKAKKNEQ